MENVRDVKFTSVDVRGNAHLVLYPEAENMNLTIGKTVGDRTGTLHVGHYQVGVALCIEWVWHCT